jgi:hypothetical protein
MNLPKLRMLLLAVVLLAYSRAPAAAQSATGSVIGRVLAGDSGAGLSNAPVFAYNEQNKVVASTNADTAGLFALNLPPGIYYLNFSSPRRFAIDLPFNRRSTTTSIIFSAAQPASNLHSQSQ